MLRKTFGINCLKTNHLSYNFMSLTYVFVRLGFRPQNLPIFLNWVDLVEFDKF